MTGLLQLLNKNLSLSQAATDYLTNEYNGEQISQFLSGLLEKPELLAMSKIAICNIGSDLENSCLLYNPKYTSLPKAFIQYHITLTEFTHIDKKSLYVFAFGHNRIEFKEYFDSSGVSSNLIPMIAKVDPYPSPLELLKLEIIKLSQENILIREEIETLKLAISRVLGL